MTRRSLRVRLQSSIDSMQHWQNQRLVEALAVATQPDVQRTAVAILNRQQPQVSSPVAEEEATDVESLVASMAMHPIDDQCVCWALLNIDGRVLHSDLGSLDSVNLPLPTDAFEKIIQRKPSVTRPFRCPVALTRSGRLSQAKAPVIAVLVPITEEARVLGSLAWLVDPHDEFRQVMPTVNEDTACSTYAFDRQAVMLSPSRHQPELRRIGLIGEEPSSTSILSVQLRDPGADLTRGGRITDKVSDWPLTEMADQATRGATGENVSGYRDFRGIQVIGAWRWLPEQALGVATEMEVADVYAPLRWLRWTLWVAIGLWVATTAGLIGSVMLTPWLTKRLGPKLESRQLGRYQLNQRIGHGAMGTVYSGSHELLRRQVAIKVLEGDKWTSTTASRFAREVQLTAQLRHPNTIAIYDYGRSDEGTFYYVMEFLHGITLQELIDDYGRQPADRVIAILLQICGSLSEAHHHGIVHRDIKPSNVFLTAQAGIYDMVKVLDFGLVKEISRETTELTQTDSITGTPMYMSPESVRDASSADARSDLYSVGAVGYALLTGLPMYDSGPSVDICLKQLNEAPLRPSERTGADLPEDLQNVLMSCLRKDAAERPMSMADLADTLRHCRDHDHWSNADAMRWWQNVFDGPTLTKPIEPVLPS
ncbi:serine/threonine-protein kinase [Novipirellula artificiosorum]|nr:serine/threonine-protein kinase [Novipirellula artificiosorum]